MLKLLQYCNYIIIVMQIKLMLLLLLRTELFNWYGWQAFTPMESVTKYSKINLKDSDLLTSGVFVVIWSHLSPRRKSAWIDNTLLRFLSVIYVGSTVVFRAITFQVLPLRRVPTMSRVHHVDCPLCCMPSMLCPLCRVPEIALGSKPPMVTRIARTSLGTRSHRQRIRNPEL